MFSTATGCESHETWATKTSVDSMINSTMQEDCKEAEAFVASTVQALALADSSKMRLSCAAVLQSGRGIEIVREKLRKAEVRLAAEIAARIAVQRAAEVERGALQQALRNARVVRYAP